jgi:hypothetical protein
MARSWKANRSERLTHINPLPMSELEYTGITEMLRTLDGHFHVCVESGERTAA